MAAFVLDSSAALAMLLNEPGGETVAALFGSSDDPVLVPQHFMAELANGVLQSERRGRITADWADTVLQRITQLPIEPNLDPFAVDGVARLARQYNLTAYDAAFLELALRRRLPLATFDKALRRAAAAEGVRLLVPEGL